MPEIEAKLQKLTRDYDIYRSQYEQLVQRKESARLSREANLSRNDQFRVIEPPRTSAVPVKPDRIILNTVVLLGAWGAAIGLALLLSQLAA